MSNIDNAFLLSCWFDHLSQHNRILTRTIEETHSHLRLLERTMSEQRTGTLRLLERFMNNNNNNNNNNTNTNNTNTNTNFTSYGSNVFGNTNNNSRNTSFRTRPLWRFNPPPPPPPSRLFPHRNRNRNRQVNNVIMSSLNRFAGFNRNIPTSLQIHDSTTSYNWRDIKNNTDQEICPITQQNFCDVDNVLKINYCGHIFKKESLVTWFGRSSLCPVCRHDITNADDLSFNRLDNSSNDIETPSNISNRLDDLVNAFENLDLSNNYILDVSFDVISPSPINLQNIHNSRNATTNTDISYNAFPSIP